MLDGLLLLRPCRVYAELLTTQESVDGFGFSSGYDSHGLAGYGPRKRCSIDFLANPGQAFSIGKAAGERASEDRRWAW